MQSVRSLSGASADDICEALLHVAVYAGVPAANRAIKIAKAVFAELEDTARAADETNRGEE